MAHQPLSSLLLFWRRERVPSNLWKPYWNSEPAYKMCGQILATCVGGKKVHISLTQHVLILTMKNNYQESFKSIL